MPDPGAVVNSGPLIALSLIHQLDLLRVLFPTVHTPEAVYQEIVVTGAGRPGSEELSNASWIHRAIVAPPPDPLLLRELGRGEAEVIAFAALHPGVTVILDDKRARRIARIAYGLSVLGTAGILVRAKRAGKIASVKPAFDSLVAGGYFLSAPLISEALKAAGE